MRPHDIRKAFTLVELLVVTGLMGALLGLILVGFRPNEDAQIRQAANTLASVIRHSQTLAMSSPQGASLVLVTASTGASTASVWQGDVLPTIRGSGLFALTSGSSGSLTSCLPINADSVLPGYQVRFSTSGASNAGPWGPWLGFSGTAPLPNVFLQPELGQTPSTVVLPPSGPVSFEMPQRPIKSLAISLPKLAVIDTRWSSIGNDIDPNAPFVFNAASTGTLTISSTTSPFKTSLVSLARGTLASAADIAISFDRSGTVTSVLALPSVGMSVKPNAPLTPTSPIYFLVTGVSAASAANALDIVQSSSPIWVAINPATGAVQTGKNQPPGSIALTGLGKSAVASRIDAYFRSLRANVFPTPFAEPGK